MGGSILGNIFGQNSTNRQNQANREMQKMQNNFNANQAKMNRQFISGMQDKSQQFQTDERNSQNSWSELMYNKYQSPQALAKAFKSAGLNPYLALDQSGVGNIAASSGSSAGAPSGGSGSLAQGVAPPYQSVTSDSQAFANIANSLKSIADARKAGVETSQLEAMFADSVAKNRNERLLSDLDVNIKRLYGLKSAKATWEKLVAECDKTKVDITQVQAYTNKLVHDGVISKYAAETFMENFRNQQNNLIADTFAKEQSGFNSQQQAITEFIKRDLISSQVRKTIAEVGATEALKEFTNTQNRILKLDENIKKASNEEAKQAAIQQYTAEYYKFMYDGFRLYNLVKPRLNGGNDSAMTQFLDGLYELTNSGFPVDVKRVNESSSTSHSTVNSSSHSH